MKETIFHPEARAEMRESIDFYEARLEGLGLRFLSAVEETTARISAQPEAGAPLGGELRKRIVHGFPYNVIYRVWEDYIYTSLPLLTNIVVQVTGATDPAVAKFRGHNTNFFGQGNVSFFSLR